MFSRNKVENGYVQSVLTSDGVLCVCCTYRLSKLVEELIKQALYRYISSGLFYSLTSLCSIKATLMHQPLPLPVQSSSTHLPTHTLTMCMCKRKGTQRACGPQLLVVNSNGPWTIVSPSLSLNHPSYLSSRWLISVKCTLEES